MDLGHLATIMVTTPVTRDALADLLAQLLKKGKQMKSTNTALITERDISFVIHQLDEYSLARWARLQRDGVDVGPILCDGEHDAVPRGSSALAESPRKADDPAARERPC